MLEGGEGARLAFATFFREGHALDHNRGSVQSGGEPTTGGVSSPGEKVAAREAEA